MFTLGRAYLKLAQELYINLPAVGKKALNLYVMFINIICEVKYMVLILSFHLICNKVVKLVYNTKYFHRICTTIIYFPEE